MSINLHTKYAPKIVDKFTHESFLTGRAKGEYDFTGVRTIHISNILTQPLNNYDKADANGTSTSRYGARKELQDAYQELTLGYDKSFHITIDKGNNTDQQMMKKAGHILSQEIREQFVPFCDKTTLADWVLGAGKSYALTSSFDGDDILDMLVDVETYFGNKFVPINDRYVAIKNTDIGLLRKATRWQYLERQTEKYLENGDVVKFNTLKIFGMPDDWFPTNCEMVVFQSKAVLNPMKIKDTRIVTDSEEVDGDVLLGRFYFGAFVIGARCDAVVGVFTNGNKSADITFGTDSSTSGITITASGATKIYFTDDGTDPRYSATRKEYSAPLTTYTAGDHLDAVAVTTNKGIGDVKGKDVT